MTGLQIWIAPKDGKTPSYPPEMASSVFLEGKLECFSILEGGCQGGATSVALICRTKDGKLIFAETTATLMRNAVAALEGAEQRFADDRTQEEHDVKVGDKFRFPSGELAHVIELQPAFVARVNGSEYCIEGTALSFAGMVESSRAEKISEDAYREGIDAFWRKRLNEAGRVERWT